MFFNKFRSENTWIIAWITSGSVRIRLRNDRVAKSEIIRVVTSGTKFITGQLLSTQTEEDSETDS